MIAVSNRKILIQALVVIGIILAISYYFLFQRTLRRMDYRITDAFFRLRGPVDAGKDILLVGLDEESAKVLGRKAGGWKRSDFAAAVRILTEAGADLIAIDYLFLSAGLPEEDQQLQLALQESANVILASKSQKDDVSVPYAPFREQEVGEGFINFHPDDDGVIRQVALAKARLGEPGELIFVFPFSVAVALSRLYPSGDINLDFENRRYAVLGDLRIPWAGHESGTEGFFINYAGGAAHFPKIRIHEVLNRKFSADQIKGKILLIGNFNPAEHDYYAVPMLPENRQISGFPEEEMQSMYGVEMHANAIHTLLTRRFLAPVPAPYAAGMLAAVSLLLIWLAIGVRWNAFVAAGVSLLVLALFAAASYRAFLSGWILAAAPIYFAGACITLTGLAARILQESSERSHITQLFGRYVAPNVVKELIHNRDLMQFSGRKQRLSVFFSDVRGFTTMSEKLPPEEVSALLNEYFSRMTRIVFKHGGTLDKFIGDALMAFFGNPIYFEDHALRAVSMAVEMRDEMQELRKKWQSDGKDLPFDIGMGVNTGEVVVGNLGSNDFFDYTVIGDNVNLACRLESIAARGQIIISESTYQEVKDAFEIRKLEPVMVKGKSQPIQIYEVLSKN